MLDRTGGAPSVPLDDAYIHFQFARAFANFTPFTYTPGSPPVGGATSLLWPALLAPAYWLGVRGVEVIWVSWVLGFLSLGLVARETHALGRTLLSPLVAVGAALAVLCFGGLTWLAASGMEALPFAWLWLRSFRRLADWCEEANRSEALHRTALGRELLLLCLLTPLMRPEGGAAALAVALAVAVRARGAQRLGALLPLGLALVPSITLWVGTGSAASTTTKVKWLPHSPYLSTGEVIAKTLDNLRLLYGTLFDGELWSATVIPSGGAIVACCALPALVIQSYRSRRYLHGAAVLVAALGMWLPATYDTFLWNRLRYLWPFAPAWFIALGALCEILGDISERYRPWLSGSRVLWSGCLVGAFAAKLPSAISDLAESSWAIQEQQVSLGRWANRELPKQASIGVNDTGAIAYFSGRTTFDVVGLTTPGEAEYWVAGAGSRFEHYERLPRARLPTHFIVYPEWFAIEPLLGRYLTERSVNASILGGNTMQAWQADYTSLNSAERPLQVDSEVAGRPRLDWLDVADLVSEREHDYQLFSAGPTSNRVFSHDGAVDGGRADRTAERFRLRVQPGGVLVLRLAAVEPTSVALRVEQASLPPVFVNSAWEEHVRAVPSDIGTEHVTVELETTRHGFGALSYFSYGKTQGTGIPGAPAPAN